MLNDTPDSRALGIALKDSLIPEALKAAVARLAAKTPGIFYWSAASDDPVGNFKNPEFLSSRKENSQREYISAMLAFLLVDRIPEGHHVMAKFGAMTSTDDSERAADWQVIVARGDDVALPALDKTSLEQQLERLAPEELREILGEIVDEATAGTIYFDPEGSDGNALSEKVLGNGQALSPSQSMSMVLAGLFAPELEAFGCAEWTREVIVPNATVATTWHFTVRHLEDRE